MTERHFIVHQSDAGWQYTFMGTITAPFKTRHDAIRAAIDAAKSTDEVDTEVVVQDSDMKRETVWRAQASRDS